MVKVIILPADGLLASSVTSSFVIPAATRASLNSFTSGAPIVSAVAPILTPYEQLASEPIWLFQCASPKALARSSAKSSASLSSAQEAIATGVGWLDSKSRNFDFCDLVSLRGSISARSCRFSRSIDAASLLASPACWFALPARSFASAICLSYPFTDAFADSAVALALLARSIAGPIAVRVWDTCDSKPAIMSSDNADTRPLEYNSITSPKIRISVDNPLIVRCSRLRSSYHKSATSSPTTPNITISVPASPERFQKYKSIQNLLASQNQIDNSTIRYVLRQNAEDRINLVICATALLALFAIRLIRFNRSALTKPPVPLVPPLPTRQPSQILPRADLSHQRPSQASCGESDES